MTNPYYNHNDGVPVYLARGNSSTIQAEYDLIGAGFDGVSTAMTALSAASIAGLALKGNIAGQTWTGTHDFSTATSVLVPTRTYGTSGQYAVNMDTLNSAVFAAANLPAQAGKTNYALFTDGGTPGTPFWAAIVIPVGAQLYSNRFFGGF